MVDPSLEAKRLGTAMYVENRLYVAGKGKVINNFQATLLFSSMESKETAKKLSKFHALNSGYLV